MTGDAGAARSHALEVLAWSSVTEAYADQCSSSAARRAAGALRPDLARDLIVALMDETDEARSLMAVEPIPVAGVRDIEGHIDLAARGSVLEPSDLADIARSLESLGTTAAHLTARATEAPLLGAHAARIASSEELCHRIDRAIDPTGAVREDASPALIRLVRRKASLAGRIEERLSSIRNDANVAGALSGDYVTMREERYVLPVRSDSKSKVDGILHGRSGSGHSLFVEPVEVVSLNNDLRAASIEIEEEIHRILAELSELVARASPALRLSLAAHLAVDLARARAGLANKLGAVRPELTEGGDLELKGLAHPSLLLMGPSESGEPVRVVRNDVVLESPALGLVISGPNTGGKTVLLKAVGLACLMARAGLPVAVDEASRLPLFDEVFADIGDEQSIELSLSTFSGHVANLRDLLTGCEDAGPGRALVLVDELMAGTDPGEGAALAQAFLERLAAVGARVIATTHYGSLKSLAAEGEHFLNAGMEFDRKTLRPSFRLQQGVPGASAALAAAERLGFPSDLVERARSLVGAGAVTAEALLSDLEAARGEARSAREEAESLRGEAERLRLEYEHRLEKIRSRDEAFIRKERTEFEREVKAMREQAAQITKELQSRPSLPASQEAIERLDALRQRSREAASGSAKAGAPSGSQPSRPAALIVGERVRSISMEREGLIASEPDSRGKVRVAFGSVSMQLPSSDLEATSGGKKKAPAIRSDAIDDGGGRVPFVLPTDSNSCDLRGKRVDEALSEASRFLGSASRRGERHAILIHGHGTGALKSAVRAELAGEPRAQAFRAGGDGEGGDGVTVVTLL